jgi:acetylglutamate kinase
MAAACAIACQASALIFLTDVAGVKGPDGSVIRWLNLNQVATLVETSVIQGGMLPKLEACKQALRKGVGRVRILPASEADELPAFYFSKLEHGTEVCVA